jgi:hypothetical protein
MHTHAWIQHTNTHPPLTQTHGHTHTPHVHTHALGTGNGNPGKSNGFRGHENVSSYIPKRAGEAVGNTLWI